MSDEIPDPADEIPDTTENATKRPTMRSQRRKWLGILFGIVIVLPVVIFALWAAVTLTYSYSDGKRTGFVQKFSKKGWLCKTWEGELSMVTLPGQAQERWSFSVRNDSIANVILGAMGNRMSLEYEEHRGVPTDCFGETDYYIVGVSPVSAP